MRTRIFILTVLVIAGCFAYSAFESSLPSFMRTSDPSIKGSINTVTTTTKEIGKMSKDAAEKAVKAGKEAKDDAVPFMEKIQTIIYIEEAVANKKKEVDWVPLDDIPKITRDALLAIEDRNFYEHGGIDMNAIMRASLVNLTSGGVVEGASTITQQLVKNIFLTSEQSYSRKIQEAILSFRLEQKFTKDEILEMYFNTTYFGAGTYGIKEASKTYFNKDPKNLTLPESCVIAALPYAPSALNPLENPDGCGKRANLVLTSMQKANFITQKEAEATRINGAYLSNDTFVKF